MELYLTSDIIEDSGIDTLVSNHNIRKLFRANDYGNNKVALSFLISCLEPGMRRFRPMFDKKSNILYWDVVLNYEQVKNAPMAEKKSILANAVIDSFDILDKYKKLNIDKNRIKTDILRFYKEENWL